VVEAHPARRRGDLDVDPEATAEVASDGAERGGWSDVHTPGDPYQRRREAGLASREETKGRLLAAADALFREQGYPATTVTAISERAGVSLQTLYLAWGSKSALFRAAADAATAASGLPISSDQWQAVIRTDLAHEAGTDPTTEAYLAAVSHLFVQVARRTAPYWRMHGVAAATDPDIAEGHRRAMEQRRRTMHAVAGRIPRTGLRPELTDADVADTLWSLASPDMFALLTEQASYDAEQFERWLTRTLTAALCGPPGR
jgi:AcrR family transcriptional regulator